MNAKKYLGQIRELDKMIDTYQAELDVLWAKLTSTTVKPKDVNIMVSKEDTTPESIEKVISLREKINGMIDKYVDMKNEALESIERIDGINVRVVLISYYFQRKTLEQIAVEMDYTYQWTCELRNRGLVEFEKNFKKNRRVDSN